MAAGVSGRRRLRVTKISMTLGGDSGLRGPFKDCNTRGGSKLGPCDRDVPGVRAPSNHTHDNRHGGATNLLVSRRFTKEALVGAVGMRGVVVRHYGTAAVWSGSRETPWFGGGNGARRRRHHHVCVQASDTTTLRLHLPGGGCRALARDFLLRVPHLREWALPGPVDG